MVAKVRRKRTKKSRSIKTESETVRKALGLAAFQREVMRGYDCAAGELREFKDPWQHGKIK